MFGEYLSHMPKTSLEIFTKMAVLNEKFALITMEPYMISALGNTVFSSIFVALHKKRIYQCYIKKMRRYSIEKSEYFTR